MKPAPFAYALPASIDECVALLERYSDDAKIIAGGQSLMPLLNLRMVRVSVLIDIGRIEPLRQWKQDGDTVLIGALVRQKTLETDQMLGAALPLFVDAIRLVGHPATRSRGTIVGSMCHADPAAEMPVCAVLLGAEFVVRSKGGTRIIEADDFFQDALSTAVRDDEIVEVVKLPRAAPGDGYAFDEIARRHGDFALISAGAAVQKRPGGLTAAVALGGASSRPQRYDYEEFAPGTRVEPGKFAEFAGYIAGRIKPNTDLHASADYRRAVAAVLVERTLSAAWDRAKLQN